MMGKKVEKSIISSIASCSMVSKKATKSNISNKRKIITVNVVDLSPYELEGKLSDVLEHLHNLIKEHGSDARLNWDPYRQERYNPNPSPAFYISIDREETDDEVSIRLKKEIEMRELQNQRDLELFESLKKKLGK